MVKYVFLQFFKSYYIIPWVSGKHALIAFQLRSSCIQSRQQFKRDEKICYQRFFLGILYICLSAQFFGQKAGIKRSQQSCPSKFLHATHYVGCITCIWRRHELSCLDFAASSAVSPRP
jgi:hypothetical protein